MLTYWPAWAVPALLAVLALSLLVGGALLSRPRTRPVSASASVADEPLLTDAAFIRAVRRIEQRSVVDVLVTVGLMGTAVGGLSWYLPDDAPRAQQEQAVILFLAIATLALLWPIARWRRHVDALRLACPHCGSPLYAGGPGAARRANAGVLRDGRCPACGEPALRLGGASTAA